LNGKQNHTPGQFVQHGEIFHGIVNMVIMPLRNSKFVWAFILCYGLTFIRELFRFRYSQSLFSHMKSPPLGGSSSCGNEDPIALASDIENVLIGQIEFWACAV